MRKTLSIIMILLLFPAFAFAGGAMGLMMGAGSGAAATPSCTTEADSQTAASVSSITFGNASYNTKTATTFTASADATICSVKTRMLRVLNPTHNVQMCVYDTTGQAASSAWATGTAYAANNLRKPLTPNTYYYKQTVASCTRGGAEPAWGTTIGGTTADNDCSWTNQGKNAMPGNLIGSCSDNIAASTFDTSEGDVLFSNMSASISSGTTYFLVASGGYTDTSNYARWAYATAAGFYKVTGATTYAFGTIDQQHKFILYK